MCYTTCNDPDYVDESNTEAHRGSTGAAYPREEHQQAANVVVEPHAAVQATKELGAPMMPTLQRPQRRAAIQAAAAIEAMSVNRKQDQLVGPANNHSEPTNHPLFCQRCFLRRQGRPDHVCAVVQGHRACWWCAQVHQRCIEIPEEFNGLVQAALELNGVDQARAIADIQQRIRMRTRRLNQEASQFVPLWKTKSRY